MTYADGSSVGLGDRVSLDGGRGFFGVVVAVIGEAYSPDFPEADWSSLQAGMLVKTTEAGLVHLPAATPEVVLVEKAKD